MAQNNDLSIGIRLGNTGEVLDSLDKVQKYLESLRKRLDNLQSGKSITEALGGDKVALADMRSGLEDISTEFRDLAKNLKGIDPRKLRTSAAEMNNLLAETENTERAISSFAIEMGEVGQSIGDTFVDATAKTGSLGAGLDLLTDKTSGFKEALANATDPETMRGLKTQIDNVKSDMESLVETAKDNALSSFLIGKGKDSKLLSGSIDTADLSDMIRSPLEAMSDLQDKLAKFKRDISTVPEGSEAFDSLSESIQETEDSIARLQKVNQDKDAATKASTKEIVGEVVAYQNELKELEALAKLTTDPAELVGIAEKYSKINDALEVQKELLKQTRQAQRGGVGNLRKSGGEQTSGLGVTKDMASNVGGFTSQLANLAETFKDNTTETIEFNGQFDSMGTVVKSTQSKITEFGTALNDIAKGSAERLEGYQNLQTNIYSASDAASNASAKFSSMAKANKAAGGKLGGALNFASKGADMLSSGMDLLGKAAGPVSAGIEGLTVGFQIADAMAGRSTESIKRNIDAMEAQSDRIRAVNDLINGGSTAAIDANIKAIQTEIGVKKKEQEALLSTVQANTNFFDQIRTIWGASALRGIGIKDTTIYGDVGKKIQDLGKDIKGMEQQLISFGGAVREATERQKELNRVQEVAQSALDGIKDKEADLYDSRTEAYGKQLENEKELIRMQKDYDLESTNISRDRLKEDRETNRVHLKELSVMQREHDKETKQMLFDHLQEEKAAEKAYNREIIEEQRSIAHQREVQGRQIAREERDILIAFNKEKTESAIEHNKSLKKMDEDFAKEKIRRQKDLQYQLFEAEMGNDALKFFMLQRDGEKAEKEAEKQLELDKKMENKQYEEERKKAEKELAYDKAMRERDRMEARQEEELELAYNRAEKKRQFDFERAEAKRQFEIQMRENEFNYQAERAQKVKDFDEGKKLREAERQEADTERQRQLEAQRLANEKQLELDMKYYEYREKVLMTYIDNMQALKDDLRENQKTINDGRITQKESGKVSGAVDKEIERLLEIVRTGGRLSTDEQATLNELAAVQTQLKTVLDNPNAQPIDLSPASVAAINDALVKASNERVYGMEKEAEPYLKYDTQKQADFHYGAKNHGTEEAMFDEITNMHQDSLTEMGYQQTEWGLQTSKESEAQNKRQREIEKVKGKETVEEMERMTTEQNQTILTGFGEQKTIRDEYQNGEINKWGEHFGYLDKEQTAGQDKQLTNTQWYYNEETKLGDKANETKIGKQGEYDQQTLDKMGESAAAQQELVGESQKKLGDTMIEGTKTTNKGVLDASKQGGSAIVMAYNGINMAIIENAKKTWDAVKQMGAGIGKSGSNSGSGSSNKNSAPNASSGGKQSDDESSSTKKKSGLLAAKGAYTDQPTLMITGDGKRGRAGEVVIPFDKSHGLPPEILRQFQQSVIDATNFRDPNGDKAKGVGGNTGVIKPVIIPMPSRADLGLDKKPGSGNTGIVKPTTNIGLPGADQLQYKQISGSNDLAAFTSAVTTALQNMKQGMSLSIDKLQVGSNISRSEIRDQIAAMQQTLVTVINDSIN